MRTTGARTLRLQSTLREEAVAVGVARVVLRTVATPAVRVEAEAVERHRVHARERSACALPVFAGRASRAEIFEHDAVFADREHVGHAQRARNGEGGEAACFGVEEAGWRAVTDFHDDHATVVRTRVAQAVRRFEQSVVVHVGRLLDACAPAELSRTPAARIMRAPLWRGGRVVECAGFEIRFTVLP